MARRRRRCPHQEPAPTAALSSTQRRSGDVPCIRSFCSKKGLGDSGSGSTAHCSGKSFGTCRVHIFSPLLFRFLARKDDIWRVTQSWTALNEMRRRVRIRSWELRSVTSSTEPLWPCPCTFWSKWFNIGFKSVSALTAVAQSLSTLFRIAGMRGHSNEHWLHVSVRCAYVWSLSFCTCGRTRPCMIVSLCACVLDRIQWPNVRCYGTLAVKTAAANISYFFIHAWEIGEPASGTASWILRIKYVHHVRRSKRTPKYWPFKLCSSEIHETWL